MNDDWDEDDNEAVYCVKGTEPDSPGRVIPGWAVVYVLGWNDVSTVAEHSAELQGDSRLCKWMFCDEHEAFWVGVSVGKRLVSEGSDA